MLSDFLEFLQSQLVKREKKASSCLFYSYCSDLHSFSFSRRQYLAAKINFESIRHRLERFGR